MNNRIQMFLLAIGITIALLLANVFIQDRMHTIIQEEKLVDENFVKEGAPPLVSFTTVALGGFRGLIADVLWLRLIALQDEGKYFEMVQLADWIQKLQPKFAGASAYLGWNMAYNISVTCKRYDDRWRWVHRGIDVLRDAINMSPNDPVLYKELGWIYQHKLGNVMDDAQRYYKYEMAKEFLFLYGEHYPDWKALGEAPQDDEAFLAVYPKEHPIWKILAENGYPDLKSISQEFRLNGDIPEKFKGKLAKKDEEALATYLRANWMRQKYLIDPALIHRINQTYGELDWLTPEAFSIYWGLLGLEHSPERYDVDCQRMILQSLAVSFTSGRMLLADGQANMNFMLAPNTNVADALKANYEETLKRETIASFRASYQNFLRDGTVMLFSYGRKAAAYQYYKLLCEKFLGKEKMREELFVPYVLSEWEKTLKDGGYKKGQQQIEALIFNACRLLAYGDREAAAAHLELAKRAYDNYSTEFTEDRVALPPFPEMKRSMTMNMIQNSPELARALKAELAAEQAAQDENSANDEAEADAKAPAAKKAKPEYDPAAGAPPDAKKAKSKAKKP